MSFLISLAFPFLQCLAMAGTASFVWRAELPKPLLFAMVAFLATFGLHRVIQSGSELLGLFSSRGYFVKARNPPNILQMAEEVMNMQTLVQCSLLLLLGLPLLQLLRTAMVKS